MFSFSKELTVQTVASQLYSCALEKTLARFFTGQVDTLSVNEIPEMVYV